MKAPRASLFKWDHRKTLSEQIQARREIQGGCRLDFCVAGLHSQSEEELELSSVFKMAELSSIFLTLSAL